MKRRTPRLGTAVAAAVSVAAVVAPAASAAVPSAPSFARCPTTTPGVFGCLVIQSTSGSIGANRNSINVGNALKVEGGLVSDDATGTTSFVPPVSGNALTAQPVVVNSNLFGSGFPLTLNTLTATIQQAGPVSFDYSTFDITAPIKIKFNNPLLGSSCTIGSSASPLTLHLTTGITNPPAPNTPITGNQGQLVDVAGVDITAQDALEVDNAYAVPVASGCGAVAPSVVTKAINKQLGLPSPAGTNTAQVTNDIFIRFVS
jgi:hypothetical protein